MNSFLLYTYNHHENSIKLEFYSDGTIACDKPIEASKFWEIREGRFLWHRNHTGENWRMYDTPLDECTKYGGLLRAYISHELEKTMLI